MRLPEKGDPGDPWPRLGPKARADGATIESWWRNNSRTGITNDLLHQAEVREASIRGLVRNQKNFRRKEILAVFQMNEEMNGYYWRHVTP